MSLTYLNYSTGLGWTPGNFYSLVLKGFVVGFTGNIKNNNTKYFNLMSNSLSWQIPFLPFYSQ